MSVKFNFKRLETGFEALWPVKVFVPVNGGTFTEETFDALLRHVPIEEMQEALKAAQEAEAGPFDYKTLPQLYFKGLGPDDDATWSDKLRDQLLAVKWVREGLERAYAEFSAGGAASKN